MLEEFAYLQNQQWDLQLGYLNNSSPANSQQLRAMLEKQVVNSSTPEMSVTNVLGRFFMEELLQNTSPNNNNNDNKSNSTSNNNNLNSNNRSI